MARPRLALASKGRTLSRRINSRISVIRIAKLRLEIEGGAAVDKGASAITKYPHFLSLDHVNLMGLYRCVCFLV
ncbi:hypothetical protein DJ55_4162 [Yersinia pseudotuberculosis]|nr:hypothetical protein DJ55_4162 [Yersinia pseudotuberculosis]